MEKEQRQSPQQNSSEAPSAMGPSMAAPAFQLKAVAGAPIQRKVHPEYDKIKSLLSYAWNDWAVTEGNVSEVLSMLNNLSNDDLTDTIKALKKDGYLDRLMSNLTDPESPVRYSHQVLYFKLLKRIEDIKAEGAPRVTPDYCPIPANIGSDFESVLKTMDTLEKAAISDGYSMTDRITAFRKIFYSSASSKEYGGTTVGGGAWGILIPGATAGIPPSWSNATNKPLMEGLKKTQTVQIAGKKVDIGHLFAGMDATNHPTDVSVAYGVGLNMRSNVEAATWAGDLGSVIGEYILKEGASEKGKSMHDLTNKRDNTILNKYFDDNFSQADMNGNFDAYGIQIDHKLSLTENLRQYYSDQQENRASKRYTNFAYAIGALKAGKLDPKFKSVIVNEAMEGALAYTASKGRKDHILLVRQGPKAFADDHFDLFYNVTTWCAELFIERLQKGIDAEK